MSNTEGTIITLEFDASEVENGIESIESLLQSLVMFSKEISAAMSNAFKTVSGTLDKVEKSVLSLSEALSRVLSEVQNILKQMETSDTADQLWNGISFSIETLLTVLSSNKLLDGVGKLGSIIISLFTKKGALGTALSGFGNMIAGVFGSTGGIIAAVVAVVIAAIVAIIVYWDDIVLFFTETIPQLWTQFTAWIGSVFTVVGDFFVDLFTNIGTFLVECWNGIVAVWQNVAQWFQDNVIQPIIAFLSPVIEWFSQLFQGIWQLITDVVSNIVSFITSYVQIVFAIWATIGAWFYQNVIQPIAEFCIDLWITVSTWATEAWNGIVNVFVGVADWFYQSVIQPVGNFFSGLWDGICNAATSVWDFMAGIWESIREVFGNVCDWFQKTILNPLVNGFKGMVNGVIGFINGLIGGIISGINWVIRAINRIQFTVPDWVPGLGGQTLGFNLKELTAPQIPYLAKGAVLPANKPFLAVVGDQRHGTNVEAPLATIQEAVALVMGDQLSAMMAGFQALLEEQRATRRTIENIEVGDSVIGEAALRYNRKMAVVYG